MNIKKIIQTLSLAMIGLVVGSSVKYTLDDYGIASNNWNKLLIAKITIDTNPGGGTPGGTPGGTEEEDTGTEDEGDGCDPDKTDTSKAIEVWEMTYETVNNKRYEFEKPICRSQHSGCCSKEHTGKANRNYRQI